MTKDYIDCAYETFKAKNIKEICLYPTHGNNAENNMKLYILF